MQLKGSCYCKRVQFELKSYTPYPYQRCYCSICRKTGGGGGYAINIMGLYETLEFTGEEVIKTYRVPASETESGGEGLSESRRRFCSGCGSYLWVFNPNYGEFFYPFASAIDTDLPEPPERFHIMLNHKPDWVPIPNGPGEQHFSTYPDTSIQEWHEERGLLVQS